MRIVIQSLAAASLLGGLAIASPAAATTTVAGIDFADNAFADAVTTTGPTMTTNGGTVSQVLTDKDVGTFARGVAGSSATFTFTDNVAVNGDGNDIALFELGWHDSFDVTINGVTLNYASVFTGFMANGFNVNVAVLDLSAFGLLAGETLSSLTLAFPGDATRATPSLVAALNSSAVPEPATWGMMILGFGAIGAAMRRREMTKVRFAA
jgi:hypothetical protein